MNLPMHGVCDALPHPHLSYGPAYLLRIRIFHKDLVFKKWVPPPHRPHLGPALPTLRSHLYCCSYGIKPDWRRTNRIIEEKSRPNRKETLIIAKCNTYSTGCGQCKKQDFQTQEALHHQTNMKDKAF